MEFTTGDRVEMETGDTYFTGTVDFVRDDGVVVNLDKDYEIGMTSGVLCNPDYLTRIAA